MPEVTGRTLMMAIQAVDAKMQAIETAIDAADEDDQADLEDLLLSYEKAADELRAAYLAALRLSSNLPSYDVLVKTTRTL